MGTVPALKKHYLRFQIGFRGSAAKTSKNDLGHSATSLEVKNSFSGQVEVRPQEAYDLPKIQSEADASALRPEAQTAQMAAMAAAAVARDEDTLKALKEATAVSVLTWVPVSDEVKIDGLIDESMTVSTTSIEVGEHRSTRDDRDWESYHAAMMYSRVISLTLSSRFTLEEKTYDLQFMLMPDMETTSEAIQAEHL